MPLVGALLLKRCRLAPWMLELPLAPGLGLDGVVMTSGANSKSYCKLCKQVASDASEEIGRSYMLKARTSAKFLAFSDWSAYVASSLVGPLM